jgi:hypothetical protein
MHQLTNVESRPGFRQGDSFVSAPDARGIAPPSFAEALVDPGRVFQDPAEVVEHPCFTPEERRVVLLSWVRDELLLEQVAHGILPELRPASRIDAVIEALSRFDPRAAAEYRLAMASIRSRHRRPHTSSMRGDQLSWRDVTCTTA